MSYSLSDFIFILILVLFLPLGVIGIFDTNKFVVLLQKLTNRTNYLNVKPTSPRWNKAILKLVSILCVVIGIVGLALFIIMILGILGLTKIIVT